MASLYFQQIEWKHSEQPVEYEAALAFMEERVAGIIAGTAPPCVWFLEHPPLYTAGTSAHAGDMLDRERFPIYEAGRGGEYTYHGPGQLVAYVMMDLKAMFAPDAPDLRAYIQWLERWIIRSLAALGVEGFTREGRIGVWVENASTDGALRAEAKIAAIGVRVRKWVSFHGIALNIDPDLSHYQGIVPCGIREYGVTSLHALGCKAQQSDVKALLQETIDS